MAIIILYKEGSGSEEIQLVKLVQPARFEAIKRLAIRYLERRFEAPGTIEMLQQLPFELWHAMNDFGDNFDVLYMKVDMGTYVEIEGEVGIWRHRITDGCPAIANALDRVENPVRFIAVGLDLNEDIGDVESPTLTMSSAIVEDALRQAETLIGQHGAASAIDRVHTALHGYLKSACEREEIHIMSDSSITALLSTLRAKHPKLAIGDEEEKKETDKMFRGLSKIFDAVNTLRNTKSLAHPNAKLHDANAMLAINQIRSILTGR